MKYGFEREFFVERQGQYVLCPTTVPHDDCGFLAEARGTPQISLLEAAFSLAAAEHRLRLAAAEANVQLTLKANEKLPAKLRLDALRRYGKSAIPTSRGNIYGRFAPFSRNVQHAGLHLHISDEWPDKTPGGSRLFDFVNVIQTLDRAFAAEIKTAKRAPGYYEMKPWGVEYRSLPATVDPLRVVKVLEQAE